jgi:hypothetical protein
MPIVPRLMADLPMPLPYAHPYLGTFAFPMEKDLVRTPQ